MIIRKAKPKDAKRVAEINVIGWHTAYKDLVPDDFLAKWQVTDRRIERFCEKIKFFCGGARRSSDRLFAWR